MKRIYRRARRSVYTTAEVKADVLRRVQGHLSSGARLPRLDEATTLTRRQRERAIGFRRKHKELGRIVALKPSWFEKVVGSGAGAAAVLDDLIEEGICARSPDGKRRVQLAAKQLRKRRHRWIVLYEDKLAPPS